MRYVIKIILRLFALAWAVAAGSSSYAQDMRFQFPQQYTMSPKGVNLQTGRLAYSKTDIAIGNLKLTRNWGDFPVVSYTSRSFGVLGFYANDPVSGWVPPNYGWSHNFNNGVQYWAGSNSSLPRVYVVVDGRQYTFIRLSDGTVGPADQSSQGTRLVSAGGKWIFTDRSGANFTFFAHPAIPQGGIAGNPFQLLETALYADGSQTDYSYTAAGQPKFIKSNAGYAIGLEYNASGNVSAACGFNLAVAHADAATPCSASSLRTSYGYAASGQSLASVTDVSGAVVTMTYGSNPPLVECISYPGSATCEIRNSYGPDAASSFLYPDQVRTQMTATGDVWSYTALPPPDPADVPIVQGRPRFSRATVIDPTGIGYSGKFDRGRLVDQNTPSGLIKYRYRYLGFYVAYNPLAPTPVEYYDSQPGLVIYPEGNAQYFVHDNRGNITLQSFWPKGAPNPAAHPDPNLESCCIATGSVTPPPGSLTFTQSFLANEGFNSALGATFILGCGSGPADAKLCNKPLSRTDARGNTTDYSYAAAHGGVLTETAPAVNGIRAQTRYTYAQRYAWIKNASGAFVRAATPVWVLTQKSICKTGAASGAGCAIAGDEVRTTYDYGPDSGPNNLLLRGVVEEADGVSLRTCYGYDWRGNKVSETSPRGGLGVCP
jgi:uncharacterized protein RhaS with RHS repeats